MKVYDLSHPLHPEMPLYPGMPKPNFDILHTVKNNSYQETLLRLGSHTGTHVDAPAHMMPGGKGLAEFPADRFLGYACVLDVRECETGMIPLSLLLEKEKEIAAADFLLLHSGWSRFWSDPGYLEGFPALSREATQWLCRLSLKGVGIDTVSIDAHDSQDYSVHKSLMKKGIIVIENLTNLAQLPQTPILFSCLPLKYGNADGSPVRAVAFEVP